MIKKFIVFILLTILLIPTLARADGAIMPPPDSWVYETGQKAAIFHDGKTETLVLQTSFYGDAKDFAYIVPTPSQPQVSKVSDDIFSNLETLTQGFYGEQVPMTVTADLKSESAGGVSVVEEKQVGIYDVKVLSATDSNALFNWLKENNFTYPESKKYILDDYIQNKWFFTTAKITTEALTEDVYSKLKMGKLSPLKLVFQTNNIVYPLKISAVIEQRTSVNGYEEPFFYSNQQYPAYSSYPVPITLYIFANHKKELSNYYVSYASWVKPLEIKKLARNDSGDYWVNPSKKMFLTVLSGSALSKDMTNDLFPDNAKNNSTVGVPTFWSKLDTFLYSITAFVILLPSFLIFSILMIIQFRPEKRKKRLWIIQLISFAAFSTILVLAVVSSYYNWYHEGLFSGGSGSITYQLIDQTNLKNIFLVLIALCVLIHQRPNGNN